MERFIDNVPLARFTNELLRIRIAAVTNAQLLGYVVASARLNEVEFVQWSAKCEGTIRVELERFSGGVLATCEELSAQETAQYRRDRRGTRFGLKQLAARQRLKTLDFGIETGSQVLDLRTFLCWINRFDLGDFGAYNGELSPPVQDGAPWRLILANRVPAFESFFGA